MDKKYIVTDSSGNIDITASTAKYSSALSTWIDENEIPSDTISDAIKTVLSKYPNERVKVPALLSEVTMAVISNPENFSGTEKRVRAVFTSDKNAGKLFVMKGSNGGASLTAPTKKTA